VEIPPNRIVDVDGRDPERAPIPWQPGPGAGFTSGKPWLPITGEAERLSVASQEGDPSSTLQLVRRILALRAREPALQGGDQRWLDAAPSVLCYARDRRFLIALNFTSERVPLRLQDPPSPSADLELSTDAGRVLAEVELDTLVLEPDEGVVLSLPD
jgi:alpha-glucosidase